MLGLNTRRAKAAIQTYLSDDQTNEACGDPRSRRRTGGLRDAAESDLASRARMLVPAC